MSSLDEPSANPQASTIETIVAIATPPGRGGIGVIRLSGPESWSIAAKLARTTPEARTVRYAHFKNAAGDTLDTGLTIGFQAPHSFTGEDVVEIQGHGGPVVQDLLLRELIRLGARQARAGEFSERAFLNNKLDLTQAEAIADLINSATEQAALGALRSLKGEFSTRVNELLEQMIYLRSYVEAAIDFPEEEIDFLADKTVQAKLDELQSAVDACLTQAKQGAILNTGMTLVLAGKPNAGKSSLLNYLSGEDTAIVTAIAGTTRDIVSQTVDIDGLPVHILDTAGLREASDEVEKIGVERAKKAMEQADHILFLKDIRDQEEPLSIDYPNKTTLLYTKKDLAGNELVEEPLDNVSAIQISVKTGFGIDELKNTIKSVAGYQSGGETVLTARRRHISQLEAAQAAVARGRYELEHNSAGELLADELLQAQQAINEITGEFSSDDLLGKIFGSFCIGK